MTMRREGVIAVLTKVEPNGQGCTLYGDRNEFRSTSGD
jgi:hypothetical protein